MNRVVNKILKSALALLMITGISQALESEFKNTLSKVELVKTGENSYSVNLYTQKKFQEPVKLIKKSDLNYYILLPETNNSVSQTSSKSSEIRNITTNLYPYAGADINNGYTKVSIDTTKPLNFTVNVKDISQVTQTKQAIAQNTLDQPKVQKKNPDLQKNNNEKITEVVLKPTPKQSIKQSIEKKSEKKSASSKKIDTQTIAKVEKSKKNELKKSETKKPQTKKIEPKKEEKIEASAAAKVQPQRIEDIIQKEVAQQKLLSSEIDDDIIQDNPPVQIQEIKENIADKDIQPFDEIQQNDIPDESIYNFGLTTREKTFITLGGIIALFAILRLFRRKPRKQKKNKKQTSTTILKRADFEKEIEEFDDSPKFFDIEERKQPKVEDETPLIQNEIENTTQQEFKKKEFSDPEIKLHDYEPDYSQFERAKIEPYIGNPHQDPKENTTTIIKQILQEDSYTKNTNYRPQPKPIQPKPIPIQPKPIQPQPKIEPKQTQNINKPKIQPKQQPQQQKPKNATQPIINKDIQNKKGPFVLNSVQLSPQRGFMLISYENNINLMGYIYDKVFALHNFKRSKLNDYNIKFRVAGKSADSADVIVRVDDTKILVKAQKGVMKLEMVM